MAKYKKYDEAFKQNAIGLVLSGHKASQVARDLGLNPETLYQWLRKHRDETGSSSVGEAAPALPGVVDRLENERLRKELELVKMERDILKKAVGIFSRPSK